MSIKNRDLYFMESMKNRGAVTECIAGFEGQWNENVR